ncbi:MAG: head-tail adaptor protein [Deltaproteobacteria bacterium]|nr:head-tail adaptor protein [Deltaproteobacteria bacterium]
MHAGRRDHLLTVEEAIVTRDAMGGEARTWATFVQAWGAVWYRTGREQRDRQVDEDAGTVEITMLHVDGVSSAMRVVDEATEEVFAITAAVPIGRRLDLRLVCRLADPVA